MSVLSEISWLVAQYCLKICELYEAHRSIVLREINVTGDRCTTNHSVDLYECALYNMYIDVRVK